MYIGKRLIAPWDSASDEAKIKEKDLRAKSNFDMIC